MAMLRLILPVLLLFPSLATAQTVRQPEPTPSAAAQMFEQLKARDWILRAEALDYLSRYNVPDAARKVKAILANPRHDRWLRGRALVALSRIEPANAAALADAHSQGGSWQLRVAAAEICANLSKAAAAPIIQRLSAENTPLVKFHALASDAHHRGAAAWEAADTLTAEVPDNCIEPAARALGRIGTAAARARLLEIAGKGKHLLVILRGLEGVNDPALAPVYLDLIGLSNDSTVLADAWQALRRYKREGMVAACRAALASGDERQVQTVSRLMASYLKEPGLGEVLHAALKQSKQRATLLLGLSALSCIEADRFRDAYLANLTHKDVAIRATAVRSLAQCREVNLYEVLEKTLGDTDRTVRIAALESLRNAPKEHVPRERIIEYFTPSLLSPDPATRRAAIAAVSPRITTNDGEAALAVMRKMQKEFGTAGAEPLMRTVFRIVPEEKSAEILEAQGYVARWHVIGAFPTGFGAPGKDVDGLATVYPPEKKVDLTEEITVSYNTKSDTRFGKEVGEAVVGWVKATVGNAEGTLYMTKAGRSRLQMPRRNGVCYAYTEITVPAKMSVRVTFLFNTRAGDRVWLNGKALALASKVDSKQGIATKTADVTLPAGANRLLVKVVSNDHSVAWWAPKVSTRGFVLSLTDLEGKPVKWSHE